MGGIITEKRERYEGSKIEKEKALQTYQGEIDLNCDTSGVSAYRGAMRTLVGNMGKIVRNRKVVESEKRGKIENSLDGRFPTLYEPIALPD